MNSQKYYHSPPTMSKEEKKRLIREMNETLSRMSVTINEYQPIDEKVWKNLLSDNPENKDAIKK